MKRYKPTKTKPKQATKTKAKASAIVVPIILSPDTGVHIVRHLSGVRYRIWYQVDGKKRYVSLPKGTSLDEARIRRDTLYLNLRIYYNARRKTIREYKLVNRPKEVSLTPGKYIRRQPGWLVVILGKHIGEAYTEEEAQTIRNTWLKNNVKLVPHLAKAIAKLP